MVSVAVCGAPRSPRSELYAELRRVENIADPMFMLIVYRIDSSYFIVLARQQLQRDAPFYVKYNTVVGLQLGAAERSLTVRTKAESRRYHHTTGYTTMGF
jgi:hypothetical protein